MMIQDDEEDVSGSRSDSAGSRFESIPNVLETLHPGLMISERQEMPSDLQEGDENSNQDSSINSNSSFPDAERNQISGMDSLENSSNENHLKLPLQKNLLSISNLSTPSSSSSKQSGSPDSFADAALKISEFKFDLKRDPAHDVYKPPDDSAPVQVAPPIGFSEKSEDGYVRPEQPDERNTNVDNVIRNTLSEALSKVNLSTRNTSKRTSVAESFGASSTNTLAKTSMSSVARGSGNVDNCSSRDETEENLPTDSKGKPIKKATKAPRRRGSVSDSIPARRRSVSNPRARRSSFSFAPKEEPMIEAGEGRSNPTTAPMIEQAQSVGILPSEAKGQSESNSLSQSNGTNQDKEETFADPSNSRKESTSAAQDNTQNSLKVTPDANISPSRTPSESPKTSSNHSLVEQPVADDKVEEADTLKDDDHHESCSDSSISDNEENEQRVLDPVLEEASEEVLKAERNTTTSEDIRSKKVYNTEPDILEKNLERLNTGEFYKPSLIPKHAPKSIHDGPAFYLHVHARDKRRIMIRESELSKYPTFNDPDSMDIYLQLADNPSPISEQLYNLTMELDQLNVPIPSLLRRRAVLQCRIEKYSEAMADFDKSIKYGKKLRTKLRSV